MRILTFLFAILAIAFSTGTCPDGFDLVRDGECRGFAGQTTLFFDQAADTAVEKCAALDSQPVIIHNDEQQNYWTKIASASASNAFIILGLVCNTTSKRYQWADGSKVDYKPTVAGWNSELDNDCSPWNSWDIHQNGYWSYGGPGGNSVPALIYCTKQLEQSPQGADGCDTFEDDAEDGVCYQVGATASNWQDAQLNCMKFGANLASIHNKNENAFIRRLAVARGAVSGVFVGASVSGKDGTFNWIDGTNMDYENYYPGFPKKNFGDCLAMDTSTPNGQWMNMDCTGKLPVACIRPQHSTFEPTCTGEDYPEGALITSPGFPFSASTPCDFFLSVAPGKKVELTISLLEANSCCDFLTLYDGYIGANVIGTITGVKTNYIVMTPTSNVMRVSWQPNGGVNVKGVAMTYRAV